MSNKFEVNLESRPHDCGLGVYRQQSVQRDVRIGASTFSVPQNEYVCDGCGETRQTLSQFGIARRAAAAQARDKQSLMAPSEIRELRENRLGVTQAFFEKALGLGEKTVVRWETGKVLQPKATDNLLRCLQRDPQLLLLLAENNGVGVPAAIRGNLEEASSMISIPRSSLDELRHIAASQGLGTREYMTWVVADHLACARAVLPRVSAELKKSEEPSRQSWSVWKTGKFQIIQHTRRESDPDDPTTLFAKALRGRGKNPYAQTT